MEDNASRMGTTRVQAVGATRPAIGRINGLDGLRAIAVLAVLVFHLRAGLLPGGFIGVDVFFVVSGFLITTLLLRERVTTGRVSLGRFWLRRARRLLPALLIVVVVSTALGFLIGHDLLVAIGRQTLGAVTFSNNWLEIAAGSSYFAHTSPQLFVNFWSLAVEEQFYVLWPFGFLVLMRWCTSRRARIAVVAGCALLSAILMAVLYVPGTDSTRVYYGTDTHAFGLLIGIVLAFIWSGGTGIDLGRPNWRQRRVFVGLGALVLLLACMVFLSASSWFTYRGGIFLACLLTAILILTLLEGTGPLQTLLNHPALAWVGQRSYGIYLWHWPALVIADALAPAGIGTAGWWSARIVALVLTFAVSAASFRYIEQPIRRLGFRASWHAVTAAVSTGPTIRGARPAAALSVVLVLLAFAGLVTAPEKSQVQVSLERNQSIISKSRPTAAAPGGTARAAGPSPAPATAAPSAAPSPSSSAAPSPSPSSPGKATSPAPATASANPPAAPRGIPMAYPSGNEVMAIGDSLVVTSADGLSDRFPGMTFDAESNRQWPDGVAAVKADIANGTIPRAVIIHFGTNAGVADPSMVSTVLDALGPKRMVVLVNLYGASPWVPDANKVLAAAVKGRPNVIIADWNKAISKRPDLLQPDQIHPGIFGAHLYADTVKQAFHDLAVRTGGKVPADFTIVDDY